jgi:uridine kinase
MMPDFVNSLSDAPSVERSAGQQRLPLEAGVKSVLERIRALGSKSKGPVIVEIAGGSGSGKTTKVASRLKEKLKDKAQLISIDDYIVGLKRVNTLGINLDHPASVDLDLLKDHLRLMKFGKQIDKPVYAFATGERAGSERVTPKKVIIIEGLFALNKKVAGEGDIRVFVDAGSHGRTIRRLIRDINRPNLFSNPQLSMQYMTGVVEPMYKEHVAPTKGNADLVIENDYNPQREAESTGILESQRKYKVSIGAETLRKAGASIIASSNQADRYYAPHDGSFSNTGEIIRVRKENKRIIFAYKGPKNPSRVAVERNKLEFEIDEKTEQGMASVYALQPKIIAKDRAVYSYRGLIFSIDTDVCKTENGGVTELGNFLEVPVPKSKEGLAVLASLLKVLGIDESAKILKSYDEM